MELTNEGFKVTHDGLRKKWNRLIKSYKQAVETGSTGKLSLYVKVHRKKMPLSTSGSILRLP